MCIFLPQADRGKLADIATLPSSIFDTIKSEFEIDWTTVSIEDMAMPLYSGIAARMWIQYKVRKITK